MDGQPDHMALFSASAVSLLIKTCLENYVEYIPDLIVNSAKLSSDLFKTLLIFNELYYSRFQEHDLESFHGMFHLEMIQQNHLGKGIYDKFTALIKIGFISKFLSEHDLVKDECQEFCRYYGINNPWLYGKFFLEVVGAPSKSDEFVKHVLDVNGIPKRLISDFTLDKNELKKKEGLSLNMDIVPKPFYLLGDEHPIILDYNYFQYAIEYGVFFSFYNQTSLRNGLKFKNYNAFKGFIGLNYFEKFFVSKYIHAIFSERNQKVISEELYQDFIVRSSADNIFIFEVKMTDFNIKNVEALDFEAFKDFIDRNFLTTKSLSGKNKGSTQIVKQMGHLLREDSPLVGKLGVKSAKRLNIYPVLIYSDNNLDMAGVNLYVNERFEQHVNGVKGGFQSVKPVLMMNVNVLVEYFCLFKSDTAVLTGLIGDYFKSIESLKRKYNRNKEPDTYIRMNKSFATYLNSRVTKDQLGNNLSEMGKFFDLNTKGVFESAS
ncbi:hypothetical protein [Pedobacter polysacchareus]|uniref:hypothetical protein n=1 Tax=Pedobacter polysacchareus TaxID=2861973 RepID=UPI001C99A200|nr:hypothetical protein [Pedobacter polysacchareus]